jgi:hypothetical protein
MKKSQLKNIIKEVIKEHVDNQNPWHGHNYHIWVTACGGDGNTHNGSYGVNSQDYANLNVGDIIYVTYVPPTQSGNQSSMPLNSHYFITNLGNGQGNSGIPAGVHTIENSYVCENCCNHPDMPNAYRTFVQPSSGQTMTVPDLYDPWGAQGGPQYTACWANCPQPPVEKYRCYDCNTPCSQQLIDAGHCPYDTTQECMDQCTETDKWSCGKPDKFGNPRCRKCKEFELTNGTTCYPTEQDCLDSGDCGPQRAPDKDKTIQPFAPDLYSKITDPQIDRMKNLANIKKPK